MNHAKIKLLREQRKLTQEQAAEACGMKSRQHWNNIESGRQGSVSISVDLLERIAATLGVKPVDILG